MPLLALLLLACQIVCGVHVVRNGQSLTWLFLIIMLPGLGCLIYFLGIILPQLRKSRRAQRLVVTINNQLDPERQLRNLQDTLKRSDSVENRLRLGDELLRLGHPQQALGHYQVALRSPQDADIMLRIAQAYFAQRHYAACKDSLEQLIQHNPDFRSAEGHLLYARSLSELHQWQAAEHEFAALIQGYSGPQARYHYAQMLIQAGKPEAAREQLRIIAEDAQLAGSYYQRLHRSCLAQSQKTLKALQ